MNTGRHLTKVTRPVLRNILERERLFRVLDRSKGHAFIWVAAPPGSGKTTLIASHIQSRNIPCFWYQIDARDNDPAAFFYYMGLAVHSAVTTSRKPLPAFSPELSAGLTDFADRFFLQLFQRFKEPTWLVFDNFQDIFANASVTGLIPRIASLLPEHVTMVVISRFSIPSDIKPQLAGIHKTVINWKHLKLTRDETRKIIELRGDNRYPDKIVSRMADQTDGWVSGLTLRMEADKIAPDSAAALRGETPEEIFDYFAGEILDHTDESICEFLYRTAFLPSMTIASAKKISGNSNAKQLIAQLCSKNYFILRYEHPKRSYHYHPLFRTFLQKKARDHFSSSQVRKLLLSAALLLESEGELEESAECHISGDDPDTFAGFISRHAPDFLEKGRHRIVMQWLDALPSQILESNAWLMLWKGYAGLASDPITSARSFENAFKQFVDQNDITGRLLSWAGVVDATMMTFDRFTIFDKWIEIFNDLIRPLFKTISDPAVRHRVASGIFKALVLKQPHDPEVEKWAQLGLTGKNDPMSLNSDAWIYLHLNAYYLTIKINYKKAEETSRKLKKISDHPDISPLTRLMSCYAHVTCAQFHGRFSEALEEIKSAREIAQKSGIHLFDLLFSCHQLALYLDINDMPAAKELLQKMSGREHLMRPWEKSVYYLQKARLGLMEKNFERTEQDADTAISFARKVGCHYTILLCILQKIYSLLAKDQISRAEQCLAQYLGITQELNSEQDLFAGLLAKAVIEFKKKADRAGTKALQKALRIGKRHTLLNIFYDHPETTAFICAKALEENIEPNYIQTIVKKRHLVPSPLPSHLLHWPWRIRIFTLGRFRIEQESGPGPKKGKLPRKPIEMLLSLVAMGGRHVHQDQLADMLWPDTDGYKAAKSFTTTLHRLRTLLGTRQAIRLSDRRLTLNRRIVWTDVQGARALVEKAAAIPWGRSETDDFKKMTLAQTALDLYKGEYFQFDSKKMYPATFLGDLDEIRLKAAFITGTYWENARQWENAMLAYEKATNSVFLPQEPAERMAACLTMLSKDVKTCHRFEFWKKRLSDYRCSDRIKKTASPAAGTKKHRT